MEGPDLDRLALPQMITSAENDESMYTAFAVTVDLRAGTRHRWVVWCETDRVKAMEAADNTGDRGVWRGKPGCVCGVVCMVCVSVVDVSAVVVSDAGTSTGGLLSFCARSRSCWVNCSEAQSAAAAAGSRC